MATTRRAAKKRKVATTYHHGDLRRALLEMALRLIRKEGVSGWTLREAARRLGVSRAAPYHHFLDKETLLVTLAEEGFRGLLARQRSVCIGLEGSVARLKAIGVAYVMYAVEHPAHFRVMHRPELHQFACARPETLGALRESSRAAFALLVEVIVDGQKEGEMAPGEPPEIAIACWSMVYGLAMLWVDGTLDGRYEALGVQRIDRLADVVANALARAFREPPKSCSP